LLDMGVGERDVSELIVTESMRDRKAVMEARGDAFVALPGGLGTLEEILEVLTLKQLAYHRKPITMLDLGGFYGPLWMQIQRAVDLGFIKPEFLDLWYPAPDIDALIRYLVAYGPHAYGSKWTARGPGA
jgi:cytokinin riboside 5'-monophosphate phosphoribohydrolase